METAAVLMLMYLAIGAAFFAYPPRGIELGDLDWRGQAAVFLDTLPAVLAWPIVLWRLARAG
jgi:hypothetical protein